MILLLESPLSDHFAGVADALTARGALVQSVTPESNPIHDVSQFACAAITTTLSPHAIDLLRRCRHAGVPTVLLMDGLLEWRNTHTNPRSGPDFLWPSPTCVVACAGAHDRALLESLGNTAFATGLPRLAGIHQRPLPQQQSLLIATARRPYFNEKERSDLLASLGAVGSACAARNLPVRWRITADLADALTVTIDDGSLAESLDRASCVLTTPSTLLVEAMLAGRPTAVLHPFDAPLWPLAPQVMRKIADIDETLEALLSRSDDFMARQATSLAKMTTAPAAAAGALADLLIRVAHEKPKAQPATLPITSCPAPAAPEPKNDLQRVVICVECAGDAPSFHAQWAASALDSCPPDQDRHVLLIATTPYSPFDTGLQCALADSALDLEDSRVQVCVIDPTRPLFLGAALVRTSLTNMRADVVAHADTLFARAGAVDWPRIEFAQSGLPDLVQAKRQDDIEAMQTLSSDLQAACAQGHDRIAIAPAGRHTHRCIRAIEAFERETGLTVALLDDAAQPDDATAPRPIRPLRTATSESSFQSVIICVEGEASVWAARFARKTKPNALGAPVPTANA